MNKVGTKNLEGTSPLSSSHKAEIQTSFGEGMAARGTQSMLMVKKLTRRYSCSWSAGTSH